MRKWLSPRSATGIPSTLTVLALPALTAVPTQAVLLGTLVSAMALAPAVALAQPVSVAPASAGDAEFDIDRAMLMDRTIFEPFLVSETSSLREALESGRVQKGTLLLVMEHAGGRLALLTDQMTYHHVAQGEIKGEPWMVSF